MSLLLAETAYAQLAGYKYRKKLTIDNTRVSGAGTLTNFPVLISFTDADIATTSNGGLTTNVNGYDIAFTHSDGSTQLDHELESYNASTGQILAWVRFPTLSGSTDTDFFIYFGNSSQTTDQSSTTTWDNSYQAVLHMDDVADATSNSNNGTNNGSTSISGKIGNARNFTTAGGNDFISIADDATLDITGDITISAWLNINNIDDLPDLITKGDYTDAYSTWITTGGAPRFATDGNILTGSGSISSGTTAFLTFTKSGSGRNIYVNGVPAGSDGSTTAFSTNNDPLYISTSSYGLNGFVDEVRISNIARSADWISTEFNNQDNPGTFYSEVEENPVLSAVEGTPLNTVAGGAAVFVTSTISISTPFADSLESATIQITGNFDSSEDELDFTDTGLISGSWASGSGTLTLSGRASVTDYQAALRAVTYQNTDGSTPDLSARTISFSVEDAFYSSNTVTRDVYITQTLTDLTTDIANVVFNFDAQDADGDGNSGTNQPADGALASWVDVTGNVSTTAPSPDIPVLNANYFGERGAILFDYNSGNGGDHYPLSEPTVAPTINDGTFTEKSFAAVFRTTNNISGLQVIYEQGGGSKGYMIAIKDGKAYAYAYSNAWSSQNKSIDLGSVSPNTSYIIVASHESSGSDVSSYWRASINGGSIQEVSGANDMGNHGGDPNIGEEDGTRDPVTFSNNPANTNNFDGYIAEVISWNSALSPGKIASIYNFLCDKWCNTPSVLASIEGTNLDYTEGDSPKTITSTIVISDVDNTVLDSAKVIISSNYVNSEDELAFVDAGGITGNWDSTTGVLSLSGNATLAQYQTALRSVTYENTNGVNPSTSLRQIDFVVYDWDDPSNTVARNINVIAENTAPTLSGITGATLNYTEGSGAVSAPFPVSITDVDDTNMESATISITNNYFFGEDELGFVDAGGITGNWNSGTGELTLSGSASISQYETALANITYENLSSDPVEVTRTFSFTVNDGDGNSNTQTRDLDLVAVNSAPVLTNIEVSVPVYQGVDLQITNTIEVSDPDDTQIDSAIVVINGNFKVAEDSLLYSSLFGITGTYDESIGRLKLVGTASFSDYQTALRSIKYRNFGTIPTGPAREIAFIASDGALKSDSLKRTIEVNAVEAISGLDVWLRADVGVVTSGTQVTTWQDQSGNGNDFIGRTGSGNRPTVVSSSASLGGQPAINFVGNGDHFDDTDAETNYINGMTEFTLFMVYKSDQTGTDRGLWNTTTPSGDDATFTIRYDASGANGGGSFTDVIKTGILGNDPDNQLESFSDIQTTSSQITSLHWKSNDSYDIYVDGILNNPSSAGPPPTGTINSATTALVGKGGKDTGNQSWDGEIAEVILYGRNLSTEEREKVEDYLSEKYSAAIRKITPAEGGEAISADDANTSYTSLTGPVIQEGFPGELTASGTIVLKAPTGYEWNTGTSPGVSIAPAYGGSTTLASTFTSITSSNITFTINTESSSNPGQITFSGLQVRPTTGTLPNTGTITNIGTTGQGGATNYGSLVMVPGTVDSLIYVQQPTITNVDDIITPSVRVQLVDQFGNSINTSGVDVGIAISSGPGNLSGTTPVSTNVLGIAEFSDLEIDDVGAHQLIATSAGLDSRISSSFNIVNAGVLVGFKIERVPSGNISSKLAGQAFDIKITAIDGTGTAVTSFTGTVSITSSCTMGTGQGTTANFTSGVLSSRSVSITSVGNCSITATNSAGAENGISNTFSVAAGAADASTSTITPSPSVILNNGSSTSTITVQAKDAYGNNKTIGGATIVLSKTAGTLSSVTDNANGTYTATLTSSTSVTTSTITGTLNAVAIADNAEVEFAAFSHIWESQLGSASEASDWFDNDNWNVGSVPGASSVVLIPADPDVGNEFPVVDVTNTEIASLSLESGAQLTVSGSVNFIVDGNVIGDGDILGSNNDSLTVAGNLNVADITLGTVVFNGSTNQTIVNPSAFVNVEIDNPGTVTITDNFTSTGILALTDGELLIPSGLNLIANTQSYVSGNLRFQRIVTGVRGWRMLSSPVSSTYGDFLDGTLTQGYSGSTLGNAALDSLQPNVLTYLESFEGTDNQRYRTATSSGQSVSQGQGVFVFFFGDIAADNRYNNPLPDTLDVIGQEFDGNGTQVDLGVTYTTAADSGWNLVGNPFGATIDWDDSGNWTKTNIESTIYVWDPAANSGNGEYLTWNGTTGTLGSGLIAPFQGFWVKANATSPSLIVDKDAKTTGGNFVRKANNSRSPVIELTASNENLSKRTNFMFSETGTQSIDSKDGYRLIPFSTSNIEFYSLLDDGTQLAINNLPLNFTNRLKIPLTLNAYENLVPLSGDYKISLSGLKGIPEEWLILLIDNETGTVTNLRDDSSYEFYHSTKGKISSNTTHTKIKLKNKSKSLSTRFTLQITTEEIEANIPKEVYLNQNYPNPFNPTTTIPFGLDVDSEVSLVVYDILGRKISTLLNKRMTAGTYNINYRAEHLASGIYFYRLQTDSQIYTERFTLIK
ncbi:MAG: DUF2341 domain-containing protein [Balneola sp.]